MKLPHGNCALMARGQLLLNVIPVFLTFWHDLTPTFTTRGAHLTEIFSNRCKGSSFEMLPRPLLGISGKKDSSHGMTLLYQFFCFELSNDS